MGKDVKKKSPEQEQEAAKSSSDELAVRIEQLERMLIHTKKKRIRQSVVIWTCTAVIVAVCAWFLISFSNLVQNYDTKLLAQELQKNSSIVIESPEFQAMMMDVKELFVPAYQKALKTKLNADASELRTKAEAELNSLKRLLLEKMKKSFEAQIKKDFQKVEKDLLKRYPDLDASQLNEAYKEASTLFAGKIAVSLDHFVKLAENKLAGLDETFRQFKNENVYKELNKKSIREVESLLVESMLELWIYELNPEKGEKLVESAQLELVKAAKLRQVKAKITRAAMLRRVKLAKARAEKIARMKAARLKAAKLAKVKAAELAKAKAAELAKAAKSAKGNK